MFRLALGMTGNRPQVHSFLNHTAAKPKLLCVPKLSLQFIISNTGDSADTVDIYFSPKLYLLLVRVFFPKVHTKSSLPSLSQLFLVLPTGDIKNHLFCFSLQQLLTNLKVAVEFRSVFSLG